MAYAVVRLFVGSSDRTPEELSHIALQELFPQLVASGGLLRYSTLLCTDARIGSYAVYENEDAARRGITLGGTWMKETGALAAYDLDEMCEGTICYSLLGDTERSIAGTIGITRIYESEASASELRLALEPLEAQIRAIPGFIRLTAIALEEPFIRYALISNFATQEGADQLTALAKKARAETDLTIATVLPDDPKQFDVLVIGSRSP